MSFLNGKRFSLKNFRTALDEAIENLSSRQWSPDYHHCTDSHTATHYEAESRARREGEILALKNLRESPLPPTKVEVRELIRQTLLDLKNQEGFALSSGWSQVNRKGVDKNRAYGQFSRLEHLYSFL